MENYSEGFGLVGHIGSVLLLFALAKVVLEDRYPVVMDPRTVGPAHYSSVLEAAVAVESAP